MESKFSNMPSSAPHRRTLRLTALSLLASVSIAGCAGLGGQASTPEEQVRERAQVRWDALVAGDWKKAYSLAAPSYRAVVDLQRYRAKVGTAAQWVAAQVVAVNCAGEGCTARVRVDFKSIAVRAAGSSSEIYLDERWIKEDGQWWLHQQL